MIVKEAIYCTTVCTINLLLKENYDIKSDYKYCFINVFRHSSLLNEKNLEHTSKVDT